MSVPRMAPTPPGPRPSGRFERAWTLREERDAIERLQSDVAGALTSLDRVRVSSSAAW